MKDAPSCPAKILTTPYEEVRASANLMVVGIGMPGMVKDDDRYNANVLIFEDLAHDPRHRDTLCQVYGIPQNTTLLELETLPKYREGLCRIEIMRRLINFDIAGGMDKFRALIHISREMKLLTPEYDAEVTQLFKDLDGKP